MGLFDKAREAAEALAAQHTASGMAAVDAELPPGAPRVRMDRIAVEAGHGPATLARYIGPLGTGGLCHSTVIHEHVRVEFGHPGFPRPSVGVPADDP